MNTKLYYLSNFSVVKLWFLLLLAKCTYSLSSSIVLSHYFPKALENSFLEKVSIGEQLFLSVLLAPLLETALFQTLFFEVLFRDRQKRRLTIFGVILSGVSFGLTHWYSLPYLFMGIVSGIFYAFAYVSFQKRGGSTFLLVVALHAAYNLIVFIQSQIFP